VSAGILRRIWFQSTRFKCPIAGRGRVAAARTPSQTGAVTPPVNNGAEVIRGGSATHPTIEFRPTLERQHRDAADKGQLARQRIFDGQLGSGEAS
jgi:hypothetical protein